jgi:predicted GNAT superfamily acetyltransferase
VKKAPPRSRFAVAAGRTNPVRIRALGRAADFDEILDIQRRVWGHGETDLTPSHLFRITTRMGAMLLGGYVDTRLAGFVYSFPAVFQGRLVQHSHLLAVLPEYQGRGLGKLLKWAQRDRAIELGYDLITWTFDPLQARNANLNLHTLGAMTRTYWRNFYGDQEALVLGPGVQTDRFLAEWPVKSRRVARQRAGGPAKAIPQAAVCALAGRQASPVPGGMRCLLPAGREAKILEKADESARPGRPNLTLGDRVILAEVPRTVNSLREKPELIAVWQRGLRRTLEHYLGCGYVVDDFLFGNRCYYVLTLAPGAK